MNENHWYIIAAIIGCAIMLWLFGCQPTTRSIIDPMKKVTRQGLELEVNYILGQARIKLEDLDRQDEIKRLLMDQAAIFGQTGTFNPMGLLNTLVSIGAISFGMNRNQKANALLKKTTTNTT